MSVYDRVSTEPVGGTLSTSPLGPADQSDHSVQLYHKGEGTSSTSHRPGQCNLQPYQGQLMEPWSAGSSTAQYSPPQLLHATSTIVGTPHPSVTSFQPHGIEPYFVKMLTKQIRICAGCRLGFNNEKAIPPSPYNICIGHEEVQQITPSSGKTPFTTKTIAHYHANPSCIWMKNASFMPESIQIPPGVHEQLDQRNKYYLMEYFYIFLY